MADEKHDMTPDPTEINPNADAIREHHPLLKSKPEAELEPSEEPQEAAPEEAGEEESKSNGEPTPEDLQAELEAQKSHIESQGREIARQRKENERLKTIETLLAKQAEAAQPKPEPEAPPPDPEIDPTGYSAYQAEKTAKKVDKLSETMEQREKRAEQEFQLQRVLTWVADGEEAFASEHPDYEDAAVYWTEIKLDELEKDYGFSGDIDEAIAKFDYALAAAAYQQGTTVADLKYRQAKRWGYVAKPVAEEDGNGDEPAPAKASKVEKVRERRSKSMSLSGTETGKSPKHVKMKERLKGKSIGEYNAILNQAREELGVSERELTRMIEEDAI